MKSTPKTAALIISALACPLSLSAESPQIMPLDLQPITGVPLDIQGEWSVVEIRNDDTGTLSSIDAAEPAMTISFGDGTFGLSAGCNGIGGDIFARDGEYHVVGNMFSTLRLCPEEQDEQERWLWQAFPETGHYHRLGDYLYLFEEGGELVVILADKTQ